MARRRGHCRVRIPVRRVRDARHRRAPPALQARTRPAVAFNVRRGVGEALDFEVGAAGHFFFTLLRCVLLLRYVSSRAAQADGLVPEARARCKWPCETLRWMPGSRCTSAQQCKIQNSIKKSNSQPDCCAAAGRFAARANQRGIPIGYSKLYIPDPPLCVFDFFKTCKLL